MFVKNTELKKTKIGLAVQIKHQCKKDIIKIFNKYNFDFIQFMGIEKIGYGGQKMSHKVFRKIRKFHQLLPNIPISVDGGVKVYNSKKLIKSGVTDLVSGSGYFSADNLKNRIQEFLN